MHGLFRRSHFVVEMGLVEIDVIGLQTPQRRLAFAQDIFFAQAAPFAHVFADLGRDQHLVALAAFPQPVADDRFRLAPRMARDPARIAVRRVDGVEARVDEGVKDLERCRLVDIPAENIATEHQRRKVQIGLSEPTFVHYRRLALNFSSAAWPGQSSFSPSALSGASTVRRCACRSSGSFSTYSRPVTICPLAAWCCKNPSAAARSCSS